MYFDSAAPRQKRMSKPNSVEARFFPLRYQVTSEKRCAPDVPYRAYRALGGSVKVAHCGPPGNGVSVRSRASRAVVCGFLDEVLCQVAEWRVSLTNLIGRVMLHTPSVRKMSSAI